MLRWLLIAATFTLVVVSSAAGGTPSMLELTVGDESHEGRLLAKTSQACWLLDRAGRIHGIDLDDVTSFRRKSAFRPYPLSVMGDRLRKQFGKNLEVSRTRTYVVCAPPGRAKQYGELFEETWRNFQMYFGVRGFRIPDPEFPLTAVIFPSRSDFIAYCRQEGVKQTNYLGIYLGRSNQVALFERKGTKTSQLQPIDTPTLDDLFRRRPGFDSLLEQPKRAWGAVEGGPEATIIHEATHQLAYNTGLHSRLGWNPRWMVEGLATVFEAPGIRDRSKNRTAGSRINRGRFVSFGNYADERYKKKSLEAFLASDRSFETNMSDAYAQAWALTFFLIETRPRKYGQLLRTVAERPPLQRYAAEQRVEDFRTIVADNLDLFEAEFHRYMKKLR